MLAMLTTSPSSHPFERWHFSKFGWNFRNYPIALQVQHERGS
jgi:hypothetical protein